MSKDWVRVAVALNYRLQVECPACGGVRFSEPVTVNPAEGRPDVAGSAHVRLRCVEDGCKVEEFDLVMTYNGQRVTIEAEMLPADAAAALSYRGTVLYLRANRERAKADRLPEGHAWRSEARERARRLNAESDEMQARAAELDPRYAPQPRFRPVRGPAGEQ